MLGKQFVFNFRNLNQKSLKAFCRIVLNEVVYYRTFFSPDVGFVTETAVVNSLIFNPKVVCIEF